MTQTRRLLFVADIGGDGAAHVGDEAMLDANFALFKSVFPNAELIVAAGERSASRCLDQADAIVLRLCFPAARRADQSELDRQLLQIVASATSADLQAMAALRSADLLIVSGGGNLDARWPDLIYERAASEASPSKEAGRLLVVGATAVIRHTKYKSTPMANWIRKLLEKKPFRRVSVALANILARIRVGSPDAKGSLPALPTGSVKATQANRQLARLHRRA